MVTQSGHTLSLFRLIRWPNLVIIAVTQVLTRQCVIVPLLKRAYMEPQMSVMLFSLLVLATVCIAAGGYAINDYFDRKIDRVNKPGTMIVGTGIYPRHAMLYHMLFTLTGIILGLFIAFRVQQIYLSLIFFMVSGLLWFYSTTYKRELLLGNVVVALLTALVPFIVLLFELPLLAKFYGSNARPIASFLMTWVLGFSLFSFLVNLLREIVKDAEDVEGDRIYGKKTIPVVWGVTYTRQISVTLTCLVIFLLALAWIFFLRDGISIIYFTFMLVIPLVIIIFMLVRGGKSDFHSASIWLKVVMLSGLGYMIIANLLMNHR